MNLICTHESFSHFNDLVPHSIRALLFDCVKDAEHLLRKVPNAELVCETSLDIISGQLRSGYIPLQDGGFSADTFIMVSGDSSCHVCSEMQEFVDKLYEDTVSAFLEENNLPKDTDIFADADLEEKFCEYESDLYEPALLSYAVYVKHNSVIAELSVNYEDAPYYREAYRKILKKVEVSIEDASKEHLLSVFSS